MTNLCKIEIIGCNEISYFKGEKKTEDFLQNPFDKGLFGNMREVALRNCGWEALKVKENKSMHNYFDEEARQTIDKIDMEELEGNSTTNSQVIIHSEEYGEKKEMENDEISKRVLFSYFENLKNNFKKVQYIPKEKVLFSLLQVECFVQKIVLAKLLKKIKKC